MREHTRLLAPASVLTLMTMLAGSASAQDVSPAKADMLKAKRPYSPFVDRHFAEYVYWGDTHLHTSYSTDAGMIGNKLGPEEAYRFARGEEVVSSSGLRARLVRPLDFLVVSDHAENLGLAPMIRESNPDLLRIPFGKKLHDMVKSGKGYEAFIEWGQTIISRKDGINSKEIARSMWEHITRTADRFNEPGVFTALIGFEWTSTPDGNNLHRVVIFRDGADRTRRVLPFSQFDSTDPEELWRYMAQYQRATGGDVLAIPHNGNLSNGLMFAVEKMDGKPIDKDYAQRRARWEPIYEVTQIKGDGEAHPFLSPNDEFADYGTWDKGDIAGMVAKENGMLQHEYARSALKLGLMLEQKTGVNPYKFGMIGSTDAHTSLATTREENYFGKLAGSEPAADRYKHYVIRSLSGNEKLSTFAWEEVASGLAAVWARANTREAIFDAMQRKETYATTGTRIIVRFFGGWDFEKDDVFRTDLAQTGYRQGVPMGGDLPSGPARKAPTFMVAALKDPWSGNLDRIQIVKGWLDERGELHEKIYNVALSDGRSRVAEASGGKVPPVGSTVDVKSATYTNTIGDAQLRAVWTDPDFTPNHRAVYYARVIEIPTPSWTAYDAKRFGIKMPAHVSMTTQERAYTSPIWYTPRK